MSEQTVKLRVTTDGFAAAGQQVDVLGKKSSAAGQSISSGMQQASSATAAFSAATASAATTSTRSHRQIGSGVESIGTQLQRLRNEVTVLAAVGVSGAAIRQIVSAADAYTNLTSKIRLVADSEQQALAIRSQTLAIANETRQSFEATAELYTRMARSTEALNLTQAQTLRITETINKAFVVSGAAAQESAAAIIQLSQGLAAGALRGEEFNSVAEQAPILMDMLAKSLGVTRGELRAMAQDGKLTAEIVTKALLEGSADIDQQFSGMALTVSGAFQQLKNEALQFVGSASEATAASALLTGGISLLASGFVPLATAAAAITVVMGTNYVAALVASMMAKRAAAAESALLATAELNAARAAEAEALALVAKHRAMTAVGIVTAEATVAENAYAAAVMRTQAALVATTGATAGLRGAMLALVGGPIGLAVLAIGALGVGIYNAIEAEREHREAVDEGVESMAIAADTAERLAAGYESLAGASFDEAASELAQMNEKLIEQQKLLDEARISAERFAGVGTTARFGNFNPQLDQAISDALRLEAAMSAMRTEMASVADAAARQFAPALDTAAEAMRNAAGAASGGDLVGAWNTLTAGMRAARTEMTDIAAADAQTAQFVDGLKTKLKEASEAAETAGMSAVQVAEHYLDQGIASAEAANKGQEFIDSLREQGRQLIALITQSEAAKAATKDIAKAERDAANERRRAAKEGEDYLKALQDEVATFGLSEAALDQYTLAHTEGLTPAMREAASAALAQIEANRKLKAAWDQAASAASSLKTGNAQLREQIAQQQDKLRGLTVTQVAINAARRQAVMLEQQLALAKGGLTEEMRNELQASVALVEQYENNEDILAGMSDSASELDRILSGLDDIGLGGLRRDMELVTRELEKARDTSLDTFDPDRVAELQAALGELRHGMVVGVVQTAQDGLRSLQSMAEDGSDAFKALQVAIDALTLVQAISAVLNQGNGDPYTAFARMAAMAAAVASLGVSVGGLAGGFGNVAQDRQDTQGTGSVLGDAQADSASILNAVEITANATSQLVGINRSMLSALQAMQAGLSGASTLLARGAGDVDFAAPGAAPLNAITRGANIGVQIFTGGLFGDLIASISRSVLGARSKITDTGLLIGGGLLSDLLDGITVAAYQEVSSRSWWFGSTHTNVDTQALGDDVAAQFQLVLDSMADAVRSGAQALGLNMEEVNAAIAAYQIEEIRISTMDLSPEEAQAELEAVFGKIFDGLAGSVVPFIGQFQQVGEGLGETLVRVATGVQVTQEAVRQLGFSLDETDPEKFAQISEGLIEMAGGIDAFISSMSDFVNAFAPESHKFEVAQTALNTAFSEAGLVLPETREGMWDLMQSLDATTESGQRQIATLLRLAGTADSYYTMLEQQADEATQAAQDAAAEQQALLDAQADYSDFIESILRETQQLSTYASAMRDVDDWRTNAVEQANAHARAAGAAGASEQALALIEMRAAQMRAVALAQLREETQSLVDQLYGAGDADVGEALTSGIESAGNAAADYWEQQRQSALTLQQYLDSMLLGDTSALTPAEQLAEAWNQLNAAVASGDASSATQLADVYLRLLRGAEASGDDYNSGFWQVRELLQGMLSNVSGATGPTGDNWGGTMTAGEAAQVAETNRLELAVQLAQHLADFSSAIGQTVWELMDSMGINLMSLTEDLGINLDTITGETVLALVNMADLLGVSLTDLTGQMGLTLSDLGDGITELTTQMGIDLTSMTVASTQSLATLANQLGVDLTELSASVGVDLGNLADSQSLLNQALQAEVAKLPAGQGTALKPYLDAITNATTEADANEAIATLGTYVNTLAPDIRNQLAPYLSNVFPADAMDDLDYLSTLSTTASTQLEVAVRAADLLDRIASNTAASNSAAGVPSYAVGTWNVPATGPAILHAGEMVLPVPMANAWRAGNIGGNGGSDAAVVAELRRIADRLERLERVDAQGTEAIVKAVVATGERSDAANDRSRGQHAAMRRGVTA
jgi:tape measure domain-containing protein